MALSTDQYGYLIDPLVPITDDKGTTIKDGFLRVYIAGSSTPVITYRNFDGAVNEKTIELDNSGRCKYPVIVNKSLAYKVVVYDAQHSQETPIITVDKMFAIGASVTAGAGSTVVQGLDGLTTKPSGFVDASVVGTDGYVAIDHTLVTDDLDTDAKVTAVENDRYIPLLNNDVNDPDSKIKLNRLKQWFHSGIFEEVNDLTEAVDFNADDELLVVSPNSTRKMLWTTLANKVLGFIKSLSTTITSFRTGDVIPVDGPSGTAKMGKDDLLNETTASAVSNTRTLTIKSQTFLDVVVAKGTQVSVTITPSANGYFSVALGNNDTYTQGGSTTALTANTPYTFAYTASNNYRQMRINNINNVNADVVIVNAYSVADSVFDASKVPSLINSFAKEFDPLHTYIHGEFFASNGQFYRTKKDFTGSQSNIERVADPWMVSDIADLFKKNRVILDFPTYDYYVSSSGVIASVGNFAITDYLDITDATSITVGACFGNQYGAGVAFFDGDKNYLGSIYDDGEGGYSGTGDFMVRTINRADFPVGSQYIIVSGKLSYEHRNYVILDGVDTDILVHKVSEDTAASVFSNVKNYLKGMVVSFFGKLYTPKTYNYKTDFSSANFDEVKIGDLLERTFSEGYKKITRFPFYNRFVSNTGNYLVEAGWCTTEYIDIEGVDALVALGNFGNQFGGGLSFYDKDFVFISNIHDKGDGTYGTNKLHILRSFTSSDFPAGAKYVRLTSVDSNDTKDRFIAISSASIKGGEVAKKETLNLSKVCGWLSADKASITTNGTLEIKETPDAKNNVVVQCRAEFSTFGRLAIYRGNGAMRYGHIEIDDTNLYEYSVVTNNLSHTIPHGLTLGEYVNVTISVGQIANRKGNIVLLSGGGKFEKEIDWLGCAGNLTMKSVNGDYTNCKLRIGGDGYRMDTWVFADSYGDSWPWRLSALAPNAKFFLDAFSGRNSFDAYYSLISGLRIGFKPKRLVWALGMNDADSGAINADWKIAFDNVKLLCKQMDIEFIPCTIPCTPIRDNSYKDAYIKANAEQYVDVADCVGASVASSPWFTGLLGDDQIHPTEAGAFVIANEVIGTLGLVNG